MLNTAHFPKARRYWRMGKMYDWSEVTVHPMAHALHYGTSVFEGIRAYPTAKGPAIFRLSEHIDRFLYSAGIAGMKVPYGKDEIVEVCKQIFRENQLVSGYIRPLLFYAYGNLGLVPKASPVELVVAAWEWGAYLGEASALGVAVYIVPWRRIHHTQLDMKAKLGGLYMQSAICGFEARAQGADEAMFLNMEGRVAEGPGENIFIVKDGVLKTNDLSESVLEGITRASVLEIARDLRIPTVVGPIPKEELFGADEAFFTGTAVEVTPIVRVADGSRNGRGRSDHVIGEGRVGTLTVRLRQAFHDVVRGKTNGYERWLTIT